MRVEPHGIGSIVHVIKRGARGMEIVRDKNDRQRFLRSLHLLNDEYADNNWLRDSAALPLDRRPEHWPEQQPLTRVLAWTLLPNHFHLLVEETKENGIARFMQRLCGSMSLCFNTKYKENGSIFQGGYRGRTVDTEAYLRHVVLYIVAKNVLELYRGGLRVAYRDFDAAWNWAVAYQFSSLGVHEHKEQSPVIDGTFVTELFEEKSLKKDAKEMLAAHMQTRGEEFRELMLEAW